MKGKWFLGGTLALGLMMVLLVGMSTAQGPALQQTVGTGFTYQGQLYQDGNPVNDTCEMAFRLYDEMTLGTQVGLPITATVPITDGLFTVSLDFGDEVFAGDARWLEIAVRCPAGSGDYSQLTPRQALTPAPYALALPGLWTQQNATSPNLIGGNAGNSVVGSTVGATIGGGGDDLALNEVSANWGTVGGGLGNTASGSEATIAGGSFNTASGGTAAVGGGGVNEASGLAATVAGGAGNIADGERASIGGGTTNTASGLYSTIGGGNSNLTSGQAATVAGGDTNMVEGAFAIIGGGAWNRAGGPDATVGGGRDNSASEESATVSGGWWNKANAPYATIGGGHHITVTGEAAAVAGGSWITVTADHATVGGGENNTASVEYATIGGGENNTASNDRTSIGGGANNVASGSSSTIGGGFVNVGSGDMTTIAGGDSNTASSWWSSIGGGRSNVTTGAYSSIPGGYWANASQYGQMAYASGKFVSAGDAQASLYVMRNTTADATETELFLDGDFEKLILSPNRTLTFDILVTASSDGGQSAGYSIQGVIENVGGTTAFVGSPSVVALGEDNGNWDVSVQADNGYDALVVKVTGAAGVNIRWVATVRTAEVSW